MYFFQNTPHVVDIDLDESSVNNKWNVWEAYTVLQVRPKTPGMLNMATWFH